MTKCVICLSLALFNSLTVATDLADERHHKQAQQGCHACHTERLPEGRDSHKCQVCHESNDVRPLQRVSTRRQTEQTARQNFPPGMSMTMYYSPSRLGAEPNPMKRIPSGPFTMGSNSRLEDEGPEHSVTLPDYLIDVYEVTNLQYKSFIDATGHRSPQHFRNRTFPQGKADHPVVYVSWYDAQDYCHWAGKRLPTEQEWEKAARGEDGRTFPWGDEFALDAANTPVRWAKLKQEGDTTPVGAFTSGVSPYGLYDMSGNVWEWVADWYGPHPGNHSQSENYGKINKVLKGGSWWDCSFYQCGISAPSFNRSFFSPRVRNSSFGFRCARDVDD